MSQENIPQNLHYTSSHEWVKKENDGSYRVGITDHAQQLLGDLVFVELPEIGRTYSQGQEIGVVESVKAASDVYAPLSGEVIAINEALSGQPELINQDAYAGGWLFTLKPSNESEVQTLLNAQAYAETVQD